MVNLIKRINKQKFVKVDLFDLYLFASFLASLFLWSGLYYSHENFFNNGIASSMLLAGNYFFFINGLGYSNFLKETSYFGGIFIFQIISLVGVSFSQDFFGGFYLSLLPCMAGVLFFIKKESYTEARKKGLGLFFVGVGSYLALWSFTGKNYIYSYEFISFLTFTIWAGVITSWAGRFVLKEQRSFLFSLLRRRKNGPTFSHGEGGEKRERFFYHDLINQTHGLNLFLKHRISSNSGLTSEECVSLVDEVRTIQSLIKDHYALGHKNLVNTYEYIEFEVAKSGLLRLVENFLPKHFVDSHFIYRGYLSDSSDQKECCLIHYPSVYRIVNNLVKNIAEHRALEVEIIFDYQANGLVIETKNKIFKLKNNNQTLAKDLSAIILDEQNSESIQDRENGYGLDSISNLCEDLGGNFFFAIEGEYWVNRVFLPKPIADSSEEVSLQKIKSAA